MNQDNMEKIIDWSEEECNGCIASDKIIKEGFKVGYMYREKPSLDFPDSGWRFMAGNEPDEYLNDPGNFHIFAINTICNYDKDIIFYLHSDVGSSFLRVDNKNFEADTQSKEIFISKQ